MSKFNVGDKVVFIKNNLGEQYDSLIGKTGLVAHCKNLTKLNILVQFEDAELDDLYSSGYYSEDELMLIDGEIKVDEQQMERFL